jgi:ABC-type Co2+ transport system permease subunit
VSTGPEDLRALERVDRDDEGRLPALDVVDGASVAASVMAASVVTGSISDTALTNVVFPTPNPPATTILTEVAAGRP